MFYWCIPKLFINNRRQEAGASIKSMLQIFIYRNDQNYLLKTNYFWNSYLLLMYAFILWKKVNFNNKCWCSWFSCKFDFINKNIHFLNFQVINSFYVDLKIKHWKTSISISCVMKSKYTKIISEFYYSLIIAR